jgi:hypothetical protein
MNNGWDPKAAQVWFLERATEYVRSGQGDDQGRFLAECAMTWGSYRTVDGFRASIRSCGVSEAEAIEQVQQLSETMKR